MQLTAPARSSPTICSGPVGTALGFGTLGTLEKRTRCTDYRSTFLAPLLRVRCWGALSRVDRKTFGKPWSLSPSERSGPGRRLRLHQGESTRALKKTERGKRFWKKQLVEDGDVEPNPGPSSSTVRLAPCNVGGASSAFAALASLCDVHLDVLGLQETKMSPKQPVAWHKQAQRLGFRAWVHPGYQVRDTVGRLYYHHFLAFAVKSSLPAAELLRHQLSSFVTTLKKDSAWLFLLRDGSCVSCGSTVAEGGLALVFTSFLDSHPELVFVGDWNEVPLSNAFAGDNFLVPFAVKERSGDFAHRRWNSLRAIDYLVGPRPLQC